MITVVPTAKPNTIPLLLTEATEVVPELQVPPGVALDSVVKEPRQNSGTPVIAAGVGLIVTDALT